MSSPSPENDSAYSLYESALSLPLGQRPSFLDRACGGDPGLRLKIQELLDSESETQVRVPYPLPRRPSLLKQDTRPVAVAPASAAAVSAAPVAEALTPTRFGPYLVEEKLGRGGMGRVHRGRHIETGQIVALKTVLLPRQTQLEALRREIRSLARLRHPGIVRIHDEGLQDGLPWYAMELLDGTPLSRLWGKGARPPLEQTLGLIHGLCSPLSYLHGEGLVHRDLKPQNILIRAAAEAELTASGDPSRTADPNASRKETSDQPKATSAPRSKRWERTPASGASELAKRPTTPSDSPASAVSSRTGSALSEPLELSSVSAVPSARDLAGDAALPEDGLPSAVTGVPLERALTPVLIDFGLLSTFTGEIHRDALELEIVGAGTPAYMAPELILGESCDARADLYALGCLLFELLTGRRVFLAQGHAAMLSAHLSQPVPAPSQFVRGLPPELDDLVLRLLAKDRRQRLGHADDLAAALERLGALPAAEATPRARPYLYRPGFSGRGRELQHLHTALQRPSGQLFFVGGQSGMGKTRLALELAREAWRLRFQVLTGETLPPQQGQRNPLQPLRLPLQRLADRCRERGPQETQRLFGIRARILFPYEPALGSIPGFESMPEPLELSASESRIRLFRALAEVLDAAAQDESLLLILDDLQWADELTLGFLGALQRAAERPDLGLSPRGQWVLLGLYRTEEAESTLRGLVEGSARIELGRLAPQAVASMVAEMLALPQPAVQFSRFVDRHAEGNPFFVAEYLRVAVAEGLLWRDARGTWQVAEPGGKAKTADYEALPLPRSLQEVVIRRLNGLPPQALLLTELASVVGREADSELLRILGGFDDLEFDATVQELLRRQVLEEPWPGLLRFVHDKLHEGAYDQIPLQRRPALHRAVAEALESLYGTEAHDAKRGHHWEQAGEPARARPCYLQAAKEADLGFAYNQSEQWYRAYLRLVTQPNRESLQARLLMVMRPLSSLGRNSEAIAETEKTCAEARELGDRLIEAECLRNLGRFYVKKGPAQRAQALYEEALQIFRELGEQKLEAQALKDLGALQRNRGHLDEALTTLHRALALHRSLGDVSGEVRTLIAEVNLHSVRGQTDKAKALGEYALELARKMGSLHSEAVLMSNLALLESDQGHPEVVRRHERVIELYTQVSDLRGAATARFNLALELLAQGKVDRAWQLGNEALQGARRTESTDVLGIMLGYLSYFELIRSNNPRAAVQLSQEGQAIMQEAGHAVRLAKLLAFRGFILLAQGVDNSEVLEQVEQLAVKLQASPDSELGQRLAELRRATEAARLGQSHRLVRGRLLEDHPIGLRNWLLRNPMSQPAV